MQTRPSKPNLKSLTGLRFLAMLPVFLTHAAFEGVFTDADASWGFLNVMGTSGYLAVSFFFVLSGFVITWSVRPGDTARAFWRRRFFRVFPNHVTSWALALVLVLTVGTGIGLLPSVTQLFLLQSWVPDPAFTDTGNSVSWSLAVDVVFYGLFPALLALVNRIAPKRLWYWVIGTAVAAAVVPAVGLAVLPDTPEMPLSGVSESQYWFAYFLPLFRMLECFLGMLMARIVLTGVWIRLPVLPAVVLLVLAYWAAQQVPYLYRLSAVTALPVALLTAAVAVADAEGRGTPFGNRVMVWFGELSFAFYLLHNLVLKYGHLLLGHTEVDGEQVGRTWDVPGGVAVIAGGFVVSVLLAWLLHNGVEKPAMRRWSRPRKARTTASAGGSSRPADAVPAGEVLAP
ncbi:acyltransferase [Streptomyces chrestomyceticus JCM 4735]|uniref:Acyltransferase n=1 Tax=Streptomyces chrestomyceticus JCM 4735 TaxID=1306181 RepID=A0A7U9KRZ4_9ACTN|nr:acyltransferase [Streptomyces chrestomyceticus]GCD34264.1 acyltransferase [Streptomyces chrestomyceticus JCM 4735]